MHVSKLQQVAVLVFGLLVAGCGDGGAGNADRQPVFKVKGKITMSGGGVPNATVTFSPKGKQPVATARTTNDGSYTLTTYEGGDGAAAGDYVVLVTKSAASTASAAPAAAHGVDVVVDGDAMHAAQGAAAASGETALPEKYSRPDQSDLNATVKSGENTLDFDLKP